jgi:hypothetical protein
MRCVLAVASTNEQKHRREEGLRTETDTHKEHDRQITCSSTSAGTTTPLLAGKMSATVKEPPDQGKQACETDSAEPEVSIVHTQ